MVGNAANKLSLAGKGRGQGRKEKKKREDDEQKQERIPDTRTGINGLVIASKQQQPCLPDGTGVAGL